MFYITIILEKTDAFKSSTQRFSLVIRSDILHIFMR